MEVPLYVVHMIGVASLLSIRIRIKNKFPDAVDIYNGTSLKKDTSEIRTPLFKFNEDTFSWPHNRSEGFHCTLHFVWNLVDIIEERKKDRKKEKRKKDADSFDQMIMLLHTYVRT